MGVKKSLAVIILLLPWVAFGQVNRYMVFFRDKKDTPFSVASPLSFLSQRARDRRQLNGVAVNADDLPVDPAYVSSLRDQGIMVFYRSRWFNGALCEMTDAQSKSVAADSFVEKVELVAPGEKLTSGRRKNLRERSADGSEVTSTQLSMIGIDKMHEQSIYGDGVFVAVFDGGFINANTVSPMQALFNDNRFSPISYNFVGNNSDVFEYDSHGTQVLSVMVGNTPDVFEGGAYKASYALFITEDVDSEYKIEEYNWLFAAEKADSAGVDVIQSSLGYNTFDLSSMDYTPDSLDGKTAVSTRAAEFAAERGMVVVVSAGNEGANSWHYVTAPADGKDVLGIGNVDENGLRNPTSSIGPTADGRVKPDLMALGTGVAVIKPTGDTGNSSGTSFSSPLVASLMVGLRQQFPEITAMDLVQAVRSSGSRSGNPDSMYGYGIPNYNVAVQYLQTLYETKPFFAYPNPVTDTLTFEARNLSDTTEVSLELFDSQGRRMEIRKPGLSRINNRYILDMRSYAPGIYLLRYTLPDQRGTLKILKR